MKKVFFGLLIFLLFPSISAAAYQVQVASFAHSRVPSNAVRLPLIRITIAPDEDLSVSEIHLRRNGLSSAADFDRIWIESEDYHRSLRTNFQTDDRGLVRFRSPVFIPKDTVKRFIVYGNLNFSAGGGKTVSITVEDIISADSVEKNTTASNYKLRRFSSAVRPTKTKTKKRYGIKCVNRKCVRVER